MKNKNIKAIIGAIIGAVVLVLAIVLILYINKGVNIEDGPGMVYHDPTVVDVLLTDDGEPTWSGVSISCDKSMSYTRDGNVVNVPAGEEVTFSISDVYARYDTTDEREEIDLVSDEAGGKFTIKNGSGTVKNSTYPGEIHVFLTKRDNANALEVVNHVGLEEYLKGVINSEMPASFGLEALKAQAVCARSYVVNRIDEYSYPESDANVDDTVSFQAYGNEWATGVSAQAITDTSGMVVKDKSGNAINAMFYSTSCGYSQTQRADDYPYLARKYISLSDSDPLRASGVSTEDKVVDTNEAMEEAFASYIRNPDPNALEKDCNYFRWDVVLDMQSNNDEVVQSIVNNYDLYKDTTKQSVNKDNRNTTPKVVLSKELSSVALDTSTNTLKASGFGKFKRMDVVQRSTGGVITSLQMEFEGGCVTINDEYVIRKVLGHAAAPTVTMNDGSKKSFTSLFSTAFTFVANEKGYHVYGGGFGHGCGLSQYGARELAAQGKNYIEILQFFYKDCNISNVV